MVRNIALAYPWKEIFAQYSKHYKDANDDHSHDALHFSNLQLIAKTLGSLNLLSCSF